MQITVDTSQITKSLAHCHTEIEKVYATIVHVVSDP